MCSCYPELGLSLDGCWVKIHNQRSWKIGKVRVLLATSKKEHRGSFPKQCLSPWATELRNFSAEGTYIFMKELRQWGILHKIRAKVILRWLNPGQSLRGWRASALSVLWLQYVQYLEFSKVFRYCKDNLGVCLRSSLLLNMIMMWLSDSQERILETPLVQKRWFC